MTPIIRVEASRGATGADRALEGEPDMTQEDLQRDVRVMRESHATITGAYALNPAHAVMGQILAIASPIVDLSDSCVDTMLVQTSHLATSWAGARDAALTDAEYERCDALACGYAALAASLTALRGKS